MTHETTIPENATSEEAAVIAAAISIHLRTERAALSDARETSETWTGRRWAFAGRLEQQRLRGRVPLAAPRDAWTAAGRTDRY